VTSSKNGDAVLEVVGLSELFEAKVDGNVAAERQLAGKPVKAWAAGAWTRGRPGSRPRAGTG
jgi:hypothetical protein